MGRVGSQTGMTMQQVMGLGAVLDSNNQKVEASATAVSQLIMRIYQDPAKYVRVASMNVTQLAEKVHTWQKERDSDSGLYGPEYFK